MTENYVSVRIYHHQAKDMANVAQENFRVRDPKYTKIEVPKIIAEAEAMGNKRLQISTAYTAEGKNNSRANIRKFIYKSYKEQIKRFQASHQTKNGKGRKWQANQIAFDHAIISFSSAGLVGVDNEDLLRLGKVWAKKWSEENHIKNLYVCLHLDEKTPHLHLCFENITAEGVSFRRQVLKSTLSHCQDLAGEVFGEIGFKRGVSRELTGKEHEDAKEYNRRIQIEQEKTIEKNKSVLQEQSEAFLNYRDLLDDQEWAVRSYSEDAKRKQIELDKLTAEREELRQQIHQLRRTKEEQAEAIKKDRKEEADRISRISELRKQQALLKAEIDSKREEIKKLEAEIPERRREQNKRFLSVIHAEENIKKHKCRYEPEATEKECLKKIGTIARLKAIDEKATPIALLNKLCADFGRDYLECVDLNTKQRQKTKTENPPKEVNAALTAQDTSEDYGMEI